MKELLEKIAIPSFRWTKTPPPAERTTPSDL